MSQPKKIRIPGAPNPYFTQCFVCGPENKNGLHLKNEYIDGKAHMEMDPKEWQTGLTGLVHGGFSCMLLDEIMYYAILTLGFDVVTVNMNIDFVGPAKMGHKLIAEGWVEKQEGRKVWAHGIVKTDENTVVEASGFYLAVDLDKFINE